MVSIVGDVLLSVSLGIEKGCYSYD